MGEYGLENETADMLFAVMVRARHALKRARVGPDVQGEPLRLCGNDLEKLLSACDFLYRELEQAEATDE